MSHDAMLQYLVGYFQQRGWQIVMEDDKTTALQSSFYGSGPIEIDLKDMATYLVEALPDHDPPGGEA